MAVRKVLIAAIVCAGFYCSSAHSADISLTTQLSQSAEFNSNYFLQTNPPGLITVPISSLRVDGVARTPTGRLFGSADLSYQTYAGPGVADFIVTDALNKGARVALEQTEKETLYNLAASWRQQQAAPLQLAQTGIATIGGFITTTVLQGGLSHQLNASDRLSWQNNWTSSTFTTPGSVPFTDFSSIGDWTHQLSSNTAVIPSVNYEQLNYGGPSQTELKLWRFFLGVSYQYPGRFNFYASVGALVASASSQQITNPNQLSPTPTILLPSNVNNLTDGAVPFQPAIALPGAPVTSGVSASASDWLANLAATFFIDNTTQLILVAAQSVSPDSFGNIFKTDSVGAVLRKQLNHSSGLIFAADAARLASLGTVTDLYTTSATYNYQPLRDWNANVTYTFRQRYASGSGINQQLGSANSHGVIIGLRRDVTIIP
jgi:hypothetical protein